MKTKKNMSAFDYCWEKYCIHDAYVFPSLCWYCLLVWQQEGHCACKI